MGMSEWFLIAIVAVLVLGPDKLQVSAKVLARGWAAVSRWRARVHVALEQSLQLDKLEKDIARAAKVSDVSDLLATADDAVKGGLAAKIETTDAVKPSVPAS